MKHRTNTSYTLAAVVLISKLRDKNKQVHRRQQDNLSAHVKVNAYFEDHRQGNSETGYYIDFRKNHIPIKFVQVNDTYLWVQICWHNNTWITNQGAIIRNNYNLGWWNESDPQHPDQVSAEHFSPTLHTAIEQQQEEILVEGVYHIATLQGSHLFTEQAPILPQIEAAVQQGINIPLDITPATAIHPQLSIKTTMAAQQEEINIATGQTGQEAQRINIITNPANGALKGNPPPIFNGDRSMTRRFINNFNLWKEIN